VKKVSLSDSPRQVLLRSGNQSAVASWTFVVAGRVLPLASHSNVLDDAFQRPLRHLHTLLALLVVLCIPMSLRGQTLRGTVADQIGAPVSGVVLQLLDSASRVSGRALSGVRGEFTIHAPRAGVYRIQTRRIGFLPILSEQLTLADGESVERRIPLTGVAVALDAVRTVGKNTCAAFADSGAATFHAWDQVRTALTAVDIGISSRNLFASTIAFERRLDPRTMRIRQNRSWISSGVVTQPWRALPADSLHDIGYVVTDRDNTVTYYAPGLNTLLSDSFAADHCLRLEGDGRQARIRFEPITRRNTLADIRGTILLDATSGELKSLEFSYVNVLPEQEQFAGGNMDFVRMRDGAWVIPRWSIQMPVLERRIRSQTMGGNDVRLVELRVEGGELVLAKRGRDTVWTRPPLTVAGFIRDSVSDIPVLGAVVHLAGTSLQATSDRQGMFSIPGVLPGEYTLEVHTASLDSAHVVHESSFLLADTTEAVRIRVPTGEQFSTALCGDTRTNHSGIVLGAVTSPDSTKTISADVSVLWDELVLRSLTGETAHDRHKLDTRADVRGAFSFCGVPVDAVFTLHAASDSAEATVPDLRFPRGAHVARAELLLEKRSSGSVLVGSVFNTSTKQPIVNVEISLPSLDKTTLTDAQGRFRIPGIAEGTYDVTARRIGYAPITDHISFGGSQTIVLSLPLKSVVTLETVATVESAVLRSFEDHRRMGLGRFLTRADLAPQEGRSMAAVLAQVGGLGLVQGAGQHGWVTSSRRPDGVGSDMYGPNAFEKRQGLRTRCYSKVYLDNMLMNPGAPTPPFDVSTISVDRVEAIEYYASPAETPNKYSGLNTACGVMVIWTRQSQ
jgi:hypothetical protein